ncbi:hypothetical protein PFICI_06879 [Pestalotiopsis fici W106-1]|uniref:AB hydrolase-1 domain-containing protein n=1 Tax=Pestalotiopsis fici (strain W106-1 / CGMCC3.15140) TaxID=1229662 RepID=W3X907_PESFW|nr:uncharacterized protein PFICI_06879 [Pestalotiopsis fici W106-1]ETS81877.1 hypothetical protein PFICI_06879 [Pestalotiopsis fici W106-1]
MLSLGLAILASQAAQVLAQNAEPLLVGIIYPDTSGLSQPVQHISRGGATACVSGFLQVEAGTDANMNFAYEAPVNQSQVTQTIVSLWDSGSPLKEQIMNGTLSVNGTYDIGVTLCLPQEKQGNQTLHLQVLTHGIGFDRSYWDLAPGYSYVDVAAAAGYAVFFYDRLGVGVSSKEDPIKTIQSPLELEILNELVTKLRGGALGGNQHFTSIIGVGHSFGSALTQGVTAAYPQSFDAAVLTGFSTNASGMPSFSLAQIPEIASINQPYRFAGLPAGYLVVGSSSALQTTFCHFPGFDPAILSLADATKGTVTLGEYFTTGAIVQPAADFHGPVAVVAGNEDLGFCFGNCSYPTNLLAEVPLKLYPSVAANNTATYAAPMAGHGLNLHYSAAGAFTFIQDFLKSHGF